MVGRVQTGEDDSPEARVERIFELMDEVMNLIIRLNDYKTIKDGNGELSKEEFMEGAAQDPTIVQALSMYQGTV